MRVIVRMGRAVLVVVPFGLLMLGGVLSALGDSEGAVAILPGAHIVLALTGAGLVLTALIPILLGAVRREWRRLQKRHRGLFSGLKLKVSPKRTGGGTKTVFRMQLGALSSRTQANALCKKLQRRKMSCIVVR